MVMVADGILVSDLALGSRKVDSSRFVSLTAILIFVKVHTIQNMTIAVWRDIVLSRYLLDWIFRLIRCWGVGGLCMIT